MKFHRLVLENWRGVTVREVEFAAGITLIEGRNEIGKSTIVEAIRTLFEEMHSSNKIGVKAIQPVGNDVGSRVELEVTTGDYHFVYTKTYNRDKKSELRILAPRAEQLTGREAHERATRILDDTVDRALWNALLLEQGKEVAGVYLADSAGLARALDEAAGTVSDQADDTVLLQAAQLEYERYYTLKTGKPRYSALEGSLLAQRKNVEQARQLLAEVEADSDAFQRLSVEVQRLEGELPVLQQRLRERESSWQAVASIKERVAASRAELASAQELLAAASESAQRRAQLAGAMAASAARLAESRAQLLPQIEQLKKLKGSCDAADSALQSARQSLKTARAIAECTREDEQQLVNIESLDAVHRQLERLGKYNESLAADRELHCGIMVDAAGLGRLRDAENALQLAMARRDTATSAIAVQAERALQITLNDERIEMPAGTVEQRSIAAELQVNIPGVASIRIVPSQSANELEAVVEDRQIALTGLLNQYGVVDLADAILQESRRAGAQRAILNWREKIDELLAGESEADRRAHAANLQLRCDSYLARRAGESAMPTTRQAASAAREQAQNALDSLEGTAERRQLDSEKTRDEFNMRNAAHLVALQEVTGLERAQQAQQDELEQLRLTESDDALQQRLADRTVKTEKLEAEFAGLNKQLESSSPEAVAALLENARETSQRAEKELREARVRLAVLEDRLAKCQANGRFEAMEIAEQELDVIEAQFAATVERAEAARRLWDTLNRHRDKARKCYVQPLQEGIERLGRIVFGADFMVELNDQWELVSRTQDGKTIPYDALSVGAREQLGILTRLAAARIVSSQGGGPLIIDDALGFSDPARLETMGAAIAAAGKECQVILLSCTPGRFMHVGSAEVVKF